MRTKIATNLCLSGGLAAVSLAQEGPTSALQSEKETRIELTGEHRQVTS